MTWHERWRAFCECEQWPAIFYTSASDLRVLSSLYIKSICGLLGCHDGLLIQQHVGWRANAVTITANTPFLLGQRAQECWGGSGTAWSLYWEWRCNAEFWLWWPVIQNKTELFTYLECFHLMLLVSSQKLQSSSFQHVPFKATQLCLLIQMPHVS